ncbi:AraC family transcriptional regulator [uncultured Tateyamaria sp.]|nr:AraC family transcriptional regulator [uncultured Tateyamaria sp.]
MSSCIDTLPDTQNPAVSLAWPKRDAEDLYLDIHRAGDIPVEYPNKRDRDRIIVSFGATRLTALHDDLKVGECMLVFGDGTPVPLRADGDFVMVEMHRNLTRQFLGEQRTPGRDVMRGRSACLSALADAALRHCSQLAIDTEAYVKAFAVLGLAELSLCADRSHDTPELLNWQLKAVDRFIEQNLSRSMRIADVATVCNYSVAHFSRLFKARVGVTPHRYILQKRVDFACGLLSDTCEMIADIAYSSGFSSQSHMTSTFKQVLGITPNEFRMSQAQSHVQRQCA